MISKKVLSFVIFIGLATIFLFHLILSDETDLVISASKGDISRISLLLSEGADIDGYGMDGWTALTISAQKGDLYTVKFLINNGADINKKAPGGTALTWARRYRYHDVEMYLLKNGARE